MGIRNSSVPQGKPEYRPLCMSLQVPGAYYPIDLENQRGTTNHMRAKKRKPGCSRSTQGWEDTSSGKREGRNIVSDLWDDVGIKIALLSILHLKGISVISWAVWGEGEPWGLRGRGRGRELGWGWKWGGFSLTENLISNKPRPQSKPAEVATKHDFTVTVPQLRTWCPKVDALLPYSQRTGWWKERSPNTKPSSATTIERRQTWWRKEEKEWKMREGGKEREKLISKDRRYQSWLP